MAAAMATAGVDPSDMVVVAAGHQAVSLQMLAGPRYDRPILSTTGLPSGQVVGVAPAAVAAALEDVAAIEVSREAIVHFESTSPTDITGGTPSPAVPVKSAFQTDLLIIKVRAAATWSVVAPGGVQTVASVKW